MVAFNSSTWEVKAEESYVTDSQGYTVKSYPQTNFSSFLLSSLP